MPEVIRASTAPRISAQLAVLYISYDGVLEPIGQSQILPYLERLALQGVKVVLLTFEKPRALKAGEALEKARRRLEAAGIRWTPRRYHKRPAILSTLVDILLGMLSGLLLSRRYGVSLVHVRSYVPAVMALPARWLLRRPLLFDIRGFWVDERVEGGIWRKGLVYRIAKRVERLLYRRADAVVSLTEAGKGVVERMPAVAGREIPIVVIPTCVDTERFTPNVQDKALMEQLGFEGKVVFTYIGSVGTWYALDRTLDFCRVVYEEVPNAAFLFVVRGTRDGLQAQLKQCGLDTVSLVVPEVPHEQVPTWLSIATVGMAFIRPTPSKAASFPTKIGEYLASGLPVVVSAGVGDCDHFIEAERVGLIIREFTLPEYRRGARVLQELLQDNAISDRCRSVALRRLSVSEGVKRYHSVYRLLMGIRGSSEGGTG